MKKLFTLFAAMLMGLSASAQLERPKLVVGIMVDQMRWDYLYYYYNQFGQGGLRRLLNEGYSFDNTLINYVPTVTAIGHSSVYTGSVPALTGIAGNNVYENGKSVDISADPTVKSVGSDNEAGRKSPRRLQTTTIGDMLKMATDGKAKVIGVALKDRAAMFPAGPGADAAYWWDTKAGHYITSTYYMNELPKWVQEVNKKIGVKGGTEVKTTTKIGVDKTFQMAEAAIENEQMGLDSITDLLAISVSSTDAIGHTYGTRGKENHEVYMELDRQLADFLGYLDSKVGRGNYLVFFTADHGASHNYNVLRSYKLPGGGTDAGKTMPEIGLKAGQELGIGQNIILGEDANRIYLDHDLIAKSGKSLDEAKQVVINLLNQLPTTLRAVDYEKVEQAPIPQRIKEMIVNGYYRPLSGDIYLISKANWQDSPNNPKYTGTQHAMWNPYDAHIPFILMGWHVNHGQTVEPTHITDIAPTVCAMLRIQMPGSCIGDAKME